MSAEVVVQEATLEEFRDFICARSFDILSDNQYRKVLVKSRDSNDLWAVQVQTGINRVQSMVKAVHQRVARLETGKNMALFAVCKEVLSNTGPPTRVRDGYSICQLTGIRVEGAYILM